MITVNNLSKSYGDYKALSDISFEIPDGQFLGLLGPNGAGKTTLIKNMIGLLLPDSGDIYYDEIKLTREDTHLKMNIGVVSQDINLDKELSVYENLYFAGKLYKMHKKKILSRMDELLALMNLTDKINRPIKSLSGGMKRKLMIAKALMHEPKYIFLDEPTVGIDVHARREIWNYLKSFHNKGHTIILTSHYIEEAEHLCDYVRMIHKGEIFKEDTSQHMIESLGKFKVTFEDQSHFYKTLTDAKAFALTLSGTYTITQTSLEDVFFHETKAQVM